MNCVNCGKKIKDIEAKNGFMQDVHDCNCGSLTIELPMEHFDNLQDIKCPYCNKYPFGDKKIHIMKSVRLSIIEEENVDNLI